MVEVVLSIGVVAFCLIPILGLLLVGTRSTQNSGRLTAAVNIASEVVADLQAAGPTGQVSFRSDNPGSPYTLTIPSVGGEAETNPLSLYMDENGNASGALTPDSRYLVSLSFTPPASGRSATYAHILVTWPAQAERTANVWPTAFAGYWETVTALDRN